MSQIIDLGAELLVDTSRVRDPYLRLLLAAAGKAFADGSAWWTLDKQVAEALGFSAGTAVHTWCVAARFTDLERRWQPRSGVKSRPALPSRA